VIIVGFLVIFISCMGQVIKDCEGHKKSQEQRLMERFKFNFQKKKFKNYVIQK
jgi:Na+-transporting methylmalonyl-CoA/oxaloacetate decarboxylase gamma subunit